MSDRPRRHLVGVVMGWDDFWALCEHCLFRAGPYEDQFDADVAVFWHEEHTTPLDPEG